jgi:anthranilate phosphoribosyltransferase
MLDMKTLDMKTLGIKMFNFKDILAKLATRAPLEVDEAKAAFSFLMSGEASPIQIGAFLMGLRVRGETVSEITAAVSIMREKMVKVNAPQMAVDVVGTGGDGSGSYNISTLAAFIVAGAGVPVAKHGNRALSSKSGAADCLAALGVNIDLKPEAISRCITQAGIGFMFAPNHHPAMKYVGPARAELGTRTIFNLLGPLSNPSGAKRQLIGVFSPEWLIPMAQTLRDMGSHHVMIVHGEGLDEITGSGVTQVCELHHGLLKSYTLSPQDFGLPLSQAHELNGGDAAFNAAALLAVLQGERNAYANVALMNAAAALVVADAATNLQEGFALAQASLTSGKALETLQKLKLISNIGE